MNQLARYLTMKIMPQEYKNDFDKIELATYGMEGMLCNLSTISMAFVLSIIFHTKYEFILFILFFVPLRLSYKSFHCSSFLQCFVFSNILILFATYNAVELASIIIWSPSSIICAIISAICCLFETLDFFLTV